jgi:nicotinamidase-related amidase
MRNKVFDVISLIVIWSNITVTIYGFALLQSLPITQTPSRGISSRTFSSFLLSSNQGNHHEDDSSIQLDPIDSSKTAFVMIEYQNDFCSPGGKFYNAVKECIDTTNMLPKSIETINKARSLGCTIIHCPISFEAGHNEISKTPYGILAGVKQNDAFISNTWGADFVDGMKPMIPNDLIVKGKSGLCGFTSTNLDFLLRQNHIENVVLGGFLTNCCVESTMRTAYEHGYKVYTLIDCVAATSIVAQDATIQYNFGMFSIPTTSSNILNAIKQSPIAMTVYDE